MYESYELQAEREMWQAVVKQERKPDRSKYREMAARFPGNCDGCSRRIKRGDPILYSSYAPRTRKVFCADCGKTHTV